mgnify:CR=1 FL=1
MKNLILISTLILAFISGTAQTLLDTAINFTVKDVHGNSLELFSFLDDDKIVVIDFFASS